MDLRKSLLSQVRDEFKELTRKNYSNEELVEFCDMVESMCDDIISVMLRAGFECSDMATDVSDTYNWVRYSRGLILEEADFDPRKEWGTL